MINILSIMILPSWISEQEEIDRRRSIARATGRRRFMACGSTYRIEGDVDASVVLVFGLIAI